MFIIVDQPKNQINLSLILIEDISPTWKNFCSWWFIRKNGAGREAVCNFQACQLMLVKHMSWRALKINPKRNVAPEIFVTVVRIWKQLRRIIAELWSVARIYSFSRCDFTDTCG
jgi:hypothetical protein